MDVNLSVCLLLNNQFAPQVLFIINATFEFSLVLWCFFFLFNYYLRINSQEQGNNAKWYEHFIVYSVSVAKLFFKWNIYQFTLSSAVSEQISFTQKLIAVLLYHFTNSGFEMLFLFFLPHYLKGMHRQTWRDGTFSQLGMTEETCLCSIAIVTPTQ